MNQNIFKENYHGILTHDGWVKVAKFNIISKILNIQNQLITVTSNKDGNSYHCHLHKNLVKDLKFMEVGDEVGVRWNCGRPYIVAFRKAGYDTFTGKESGDLPIQKNLFGGSVE